MAPPPAEIGGLNMGPGAHHDATTTDRRGDRSAAGRPPLGIPSPAACAAILAAAIVLTPPAPAAAQDRNPPGRPSALGATAIIGRPPRIEVPAVIIGAPAGEPSLGIAIGQGGDLPANTYVRIRGLSPQMALTSGHVIAPGAWAVPVAALPSLRVVIPPGAAGKSEIVVALVAIDGGVLAEARTTLVVAAVVQERAHADTEASTPPPPPSPPAEAHRGTVPAPAAPAAVAALPPPAAPATPDPPAPKSAAPTLSPEVRERARGLLQRGQTLLAAGDIASARLFLRRAAEAGLAEAALAMGDTFEPGQLIRLKAIGIRPDPDEARRWYEMARDLGDGEAARKRLERLGAR
jgi:hypothetical protein